MIDILNDFDYLNESSAGDYFREAYYGKRKELIECEDLFNDILIKFLKSPYDNINKYPENIKINELLKRFFGVNYVGIYWSRSEMPDARTIVNSHVIQIAKGDSLRNKTTDGFRDISGNEKIVIQISKGLLKLDNITGAHMMAVILHEIGHNFDNTPFRAINFLLTILSTDGANIVREMVSSNVMKRGMFTLKTIPDRVIQAIKPLSFISSNLGRFNKKVTGSINYLLSPMSTLALAPALILSPSLHIHGIFAKKSEDYADSFATSYGYGKELNEVLIIIQTNVFSVKDVFLKTPLTSFLYDLGVVNGELISNMLGRHGSSQERLKKSIIKLEKDLNSSDYPAEMKSALTQEIDDMKKLYISYIKSNDDEKLVMAATVRTFIDEMFDGRTDLISKIFGDINLA